MKSSFKHFFETYDINLAIELKELHKLHALRRTVESFEKGECEEYEAAPITEVNKEVASSMKKQYGKDWKKVYYATANKQDRDPETYEKENESEELDERCWDGYEPTPGKKPYSKGSCRPKGKSNEDSKPAKGKKYVHKTADGKKVSYGAKGYSISPGTKKGDAYCARSYGDMKSHNKDCSGKDKDTPLCLSRKKWDCKGKKSVRENVMQNEETNTLVPSDFIIDSLNSAMSGKMISNITKSAIITQSKSPWWKTPVKEVYLFNDEDGAFVTAKTESGSVSFYAWATVTLK
jgi:hypothetical protein